MLHSTDTFTMTDLTNQVKEWSSRNFPNKQASDLGVIEEIGEITHGLLKHFQGIRGFDDPVKFHEHILDGFGDAGIYLVNLAGGWNCLILDTPKTRSTLTDRGFLVQILRCAARLVESIDLIVENIARDEVEVKTHTAEIHKMIQNLWDWMSEWAKIHDIEFRPTVEAVWIKVRKRDWEKNKTHAHLVAESGGTEIPAASAEGPNMIADGRVIKKRSGLKE